VRLQQKAQDSEVAQDKMSCVLNDVAEGVFLGVACLLSIVITGEIAKAICLSAGEHAK
jgi:hypothetical protein